MSDSPPNLTVSRQGVGAVGSALLNGFIQVCDMAATLRTFTGLNGMSVELQDAGNLSGGFGFFVYNSNSTAPDNNNTVIAPTGSVTGRWIRQTLGGGSGASGALITASPTVLAMGVRYGVKTSTGAITLILPPLNSVTPGFWVDVADVDYNANVNNITIDATGADTIALYAGSAAFQTLNVAGVQAHIVANTTNWRLLVSTG